MAFFKAVHINVRKSWGHPGAHATNLKEMVAIETEIIHRQDHLQKFCNFGVGDFSLESIPWSAVISHKCQTSLDSLFIGNIGVQGTYVEGGQYSVRTYACQFSEYSQDMVGVPNVRFYFRNIRFQEEIRKS